MDTIRKAFTLIELLIVVAIIAILAAIAVPNFLEAQVRSKVSRCKADMRTCATAIEAYAVDYNSYPRCNLSPASAFDVPGRVNSQPTFERLTTPISFISSVPLDPFASTKQWDDAWNTAKPYTGAFAEADKQVARYYFYNARNNAPGGNARWDTTTAKPNWWLMEASGPDLTRHFMQDALNVGQFSGIDDPRFPSAMYDPTNGTVSRGSIWRCGGQAMMPIDTMFQNLILKSNK